jgi:hypothetical protein
MAVRGDRARLLIEELLRLVGDLVPADVSVTVSGHSLEASRRDDLSQMSQEELRRAVEEQRRLAFAWAGTGLAFGAWIPFLPRQLAARLTVVDALESIQDVVTRVVGSAWPEPGFEVKANTSVDAVRVWFEHAAGQTIPVGSIRLAAV